MTRLDQLAESLLKASHSIEFVLSDLQAGNKLANALESVLLLQLIEEAAKLRNRITAVASAINEECCGE